MKVEWPRLSVVMWCRQVRIGDTLAVETYSQGNLVLRYLKEKLPGKVGDREIGENAPTIKSAMTQCGSVGSAEDKTFDDLVNST